MVESVRGIAINNHNITRRTVLSVISSLGGLSVHSDDRGIIIPGGGKRLFPGAYVCAKRLRELGCKLPIQIWHLGKGEIEPWMVDCIQDIGNASAIDAYELREAYPMKVLNGWELKIFALCHTNLRHVLLLDSDNVPVKDPTFLFNSKEYTKTGAIFWPDFGYLSKSNPVWKTLGLDYREESEWESGQLVVDRFRHQKALLLARWMNENSPFFYQLILGDKETFHLSFRKLKAEVHVINYPVRALAHTLVQHDMNGNPLFLHRNGDKWSLEHENKTIFGFIAEDRCKHWLKKCKSISQRNWKLLAKSGEGKNLVPLRRELCRGLWMYYRIGYDNRPMSFASDGRVVAGAALCEQRWEIFEEGDKIYLALGDDTSVTCKCEWKGNNVWFGSWLHSQKMPVQLTRLHQTKSVVDDNSSGFSIKKKCYQLAIQAPINTFTGYGLLVMEVLKALEQADIDYRIRATSIDETFSDIPPWVRKRIECKDIMADNWICVHPPGGRIPRNGRVIVWTMWESSRLRRDDVENLNYSHRVIVPCEWNHICFSASGVETEICKVPLGVNTTDFRFHPKFEDSKKITFGTAARLESGGKRKRIDDVIEAFLLAFPGRNDVALEVKVFNDCPVTVVRDSRVTIHKEYWSTDRLLDWYKKMDCFVSGSTSEGWGMMQHQALACGRPLASVRFGGVAEFFEPWMGCVIPHQLRPADGIYHGCGVWARAEVSDITGAFQQYVNNRPAIECNSQRISAAVSKYTWEYSVQEFFKHVKQVTGISIGASPSCNNTP